MPAAHLVAPTIDVAGSFQQGRQDANVNQANETANEAAQLEVLATGAAYAMPQGPNGPVDPAKWNEVLDTYEASGMPADKVKAFRDNPSMASVLLKGSSRALKASGDAALFDLEKKKMEAEIALAMSGVAKNNAGPTPTDDQRELDQINAERQAVGQAPIPMEAFLASKRPNGLSVTTNPDGTVSVTQGGVSKPLTEAQSKDTVYAIRAEGALTKLDEFGEALTNPVERAVEGDPTGVLRGMQSDEFQQAQQSALEFLQAVLRKDTGAAITKEETEQYGKVYLPQPGDSEAVLEQKRQSRRRAVDAIQAGLPPDAILKKEQTLSQGADDTEPDVPKVGDVQDGYEYIGGDPANEKSWKPVN
jgi:hypothetical protein